MPSAIEPRIDEAIERVILKALAKEREDRFASTAGFIAAWKQALGVALANGMTLPAGQVDGEARAPLSAQPFFATPQAAPLARPHTAVIDTPLPPVVEQGGGSSPAVASMVTAASAPEPVHRQVRLGRWQVSPWLVGILGSLLGAVVLLGLAFAVSRLFFPAPQVQQPQPDMLRQEMKLQPQINALRLQAIAKVLDISVEEFNTAEAQGQTLDQLVAAAGMTMEEFIPAVSDAFAVLLDEAVEAGAITQQEADEALSQNLFRQGPNP